MNILQAIILGIVQGLTEFIPISSTAHLVLASRFTGLYDGDPQKVTATIAVIQLGTLLAVFVYFASDIISIAGAFIGDHWAAITRRQGNRYSGTRGVRPMWLSDEAWLGWLIIIGSIPIGTVGLLLKKLIEGPFTKNLWVMVTMLIAISILLLLAEKMGSQRKDISRLGIADALIVGFSQVLALLPGASRSGSTIMGGLFAGQKRETAARFSFLLSIPAITASGLLELKEAWGMLPKEDFTALGVSVAVSAVVGYLSIWFLMRFLRTHTTTIFIIYRLALAGLIIALISFGIIAAQG
ncbi:MAG TPA: undecaprenyl-diphosphatase UppP [Pyrinomonadaceae bacterium]|jgi:undecaprenyl-diphosphatase|nr:undecaprenyl-diphosphatase UppP [Pyrinomonadaceae bacterium]